MSEARIDDRAVDMIERATDEALRELFHSRRGQPSMEDILTLVTEHFGVKLSDLQSKKRTNAIAYPRQVAMFLARQITRHSLEGIGGYFGGRDHSTVIYAVEKIQQLHDQDPATRALLDGFLGRLQAKVREATQAALKGAESRPQ